MDNKEMIKQMIDFHKTTFENCFSTISMIHDQAEKLLMTFVDQTPGISDESKKVIAQWSGAYKKGIDGLKKAMNEGYAKIEELFDKNTVTMFQDQTEKMFNSFLNQANWIPPDLKKTMGELADTYNKICKEFKTYVDEHIWRMENFPPVAKRSKPKKKK